MNALDLVWERQKWKTRGRKKVGLILISHCSVMLWLRFLSALSLVILSRLARMTILLSGSHWPAAALKLGNMTESLCLFSPALGLCQQRFYHIQAPDPHWTPNKGVCVTLTYSHDLSDKLCHRLNQKLTSTTTICNKEFISSHDFFFKSKCWRLCLNKMIVSAF